MFSVVMSSLIIVVGCVICFRLMFFVCIVMSLCLVFMCLKVIIVIRIIVIGSILINVLGSW